jgi:transposase
MRTEITPGQTSDYLGFNLVMAENLPKLSVLFVKSLRKRGARDVLTQIPIRKSRRMRVGVDRSLYRLRNLVERCFNELKNEGRFATRYDKTTESFLCFIAATSIRLWIGHLST